MKKLLLITLIFFSIFVQAMTPYMNGFQDGWKIGYCHGYYSCYAPMAPYTPYPSIGQSDNSYLDGYNTGFIYGFKANH